MAAGRERRDRWQPWLESMAQGSETADLRHFYEAFPGNPADPIGTTPLAAIDLETSGLDPRKHAILSIGIVPFNLRSIATGASRHWILRPPRGFSGESVAYHHIRHFDVEQAPDLGDVLPEILESLRGRLPVVHYHPIERRFLDGAVRERTGTVFRFPLIDTMEIEARRHRRPWRMRLGRLFGRTPASIRLADSRERYGLPPYEGHQAVVDAIGTAELLQAQIQHHYSNSTPIGDLRV
ncbi:3'-5' exonuclease [Spiribacter vilamensis]|uniref:DNA polymerase-3 subunit epsilon n=1 Tax=Spiribacter vilamensis TaxID=531306 RepID=A0A4Q8CYX2_9GAMM|nr:3'-5' exonuclease [Spiribacter vilamensis]RZU98164.1 DNA polymerase-3 subunit epsilon [Spiribacter vilamensis]TVO60935.1 3'-5' exonuclease [Spiribacter vilamensis]